MVLVGVVRSGLVESRHPVTVAAVDGSGRVVRRWGDDQEAVFFLRSAAKPFQAAVSQRNGAGLAPEQLALACGSHGGQPVHAALAEAMLRAVVLGPEHLLCPPDRSAADAAFARAALAGEPRRRLFHNCSGKHSAMLRACVARGWSLRYTDPDHPLQRQIREEIESSTGEEAGPVGVDGCGVPTFRGTTTGLARAFARLATDADLAPVAAAMRRFASLTSDGDRAEARLARWFPAAVKGGAQGCVGIAWVGGLGLAAKCWTGQSVPAMAAAVAALQQLGLLSPHQQEMLADVARPVVEGGGAPVGAWEVLEDAT